MTIWRLNVTPTASLFLLKTLTKKQSNPKTKQTQRTFFSPCYPLSLVEDNAPSAAAGHGSEYCSKPQRLWCPFSGCDLQSDFSLFQKFPLTNTWHKSTVVYLPLWAVKTFIWLHSVKSTGAPGVWLRWPGLPGLAAIFTHPNDLDSVSTESSER